MLFRSDKGKLMELATQISVNRGKTVVDTDDLLDAALKITPGIVTNLSYTTVKDAVLKTKDWQTILSTNFPTVPVAKPSTWLPGTTPPVSGSGIRSYDTPTGSTTTPGPWRGTGVPTIPSNKPEDKGGSSLLDGVGNFLGEVFKKRPGMVAISGIPTDGMPKGIEFKPSPTTVKPETTIGMKPKTPKPTNPMGGNV